MQEASAEHNQPREEGEQRRHLRVAMVTVFVRHQRHDGRRADGDGLGGAEEAVDEAAHERAVEAILKERNVDGEVLDFWDDWAACFVGVISSVDVEMILRPYLISLTDYEQILLVSGSALLWCR